MYSLTALRQNTLTHSEDSSPFLKADGSSIRYIAVLSRGGTVPSKVED